MREEGLIILYPNIHIKGPGQIHTVTQLSSRFGSRHLSIIKSTPKIFLYTLFSFQHNHAKP